MLFAAVNVARRLNVDPELALRSTAKRFVARVERAEQLAHDDGARLRRAPARRAGSVLRPPRRRCCDELPRSQPCARGRSSTRAGNPTVEVDGRARLRRGRAGGRAVGRLDRAASRRSSCATAIRSAWLGKGVGKAVENVAHRDRAGAHRARRRRPERGRRRARRARRDAEQGPPRRERDPRRLARDGQGGRRAGRRAALPLGRRRGGARAARADAERRQRRRARRTTRSTSRSS